jgi:predicted regulator of Ras-like GTPase activity (Roadblock/LC7/MglB family)
MTDPVLAVLHELRDKVKLNGSLVASKDGFLIASDLPEGVEAEGMAAITATGLSLSNCVDDTAGEGDFEELVIRNDGGHVVIYAAGPSAALAVLASPDVSVGSLHLEARPAARAIARLRSGADAGNDTGY